MLSMHSYGTVKFHMIISDAPKWDFTDNPIS